MSKKLAIAMFGQKRLSREGGVEIVVKELCTRMAQNGCDVTCYNRAGHHVSGAEYDDAGKTEYEGIRQKSVPTIERRGLAAVSSSAFAALYSAFGKYDVVHIHAEGPAFFAWLPKMFGKRVVVTVHGIDWQREKWQSGLGSKFIHQGEKNAAKYADEVIVLSKGVQKYFLETYGRETHFIPNGVNRPEVREARLIKDHFGLEKDSYILFLGRLVPEKGIRYLVEAFKNVKTDKKLVIAGGSSDTDSFMEEVKDLAKGDDRILFTGFVQGAMLDELYKTSQSFYTKFALALTGYVAVLAVVYPKFVDTPFGYIDALLLVLVLGMNAIFESMFGIPSQLLMFADQKAYFNTFLQIFCTIGNAFVSVILIKLGCSLLVVKFVAALIFILRPIILNVYVRSHYAIDTSVEKDKSVLSQSNAALAKSIAFYVHSSTDNLVITACLNVMWVSVYSVHRYVVSSISNLVAAILGNTEALFGQMIARDEQDAIKHDVPMYDLMSKMLSTVFFFTCIILITPFVSLYTGGISDIDYYQPLFATLLCLAEYVYCTSLTYNNMIMAAGHIKQTQWISVTEAIINIVLSLILVKWIGIIGVALGTLIAFAFNTVANIVYMKKYIFDMSLGWIIKVYLANLVAGVLAMCLFGNIVNAHITGFISFFIWAAVVFAGVCLIDVVLNYFFFKNETKTVLYKIGKKFAR